MRKIGFRSRQLAAGGRRREWVNMRRFHGDNAKRALLDTYRGRVRAHVREMRERVALSLVDEGKALRGRADELASPTEGGFRRVNLPRRFRRGREGG